MDSYSVAVMGQRPWTTNQERKKGSHYLRSQITKWWRESFFEAACDAGVPALNKVRIEVTPILPDRKMQDVGACYPTAKAAIDGLVDAGVLEDDSPQYVSTITFHSPVVLKRRMGLELLIIPENDNE